MEQRNLVLAIVLSLVILLGFQVILEQVMPPPPPKEEQQQTTAEEDALPQAEPGAPATVPGAQPDTEKPAGRDREAIIKEGRRVRLDSPTLRGSWSLEAGRLDDLILKRYNETVNPTSPEIQLLTPPGTPNPYFADFGWVTPHEDVAVPKGDITWESSGETLTPGQPVTFTWDNGSGLVFEREISVDEQYMFTVTQRVTNNGDSPVALQPYGLISRTGTPDVLGFYILHEGLIGVFDGTLEEVDYDDVRDDGTIQQSTTGGWIGITDKYWLVALVPDQKQTVNTRFVYSGRGGRDKYQSDILYPVRTVVPGGFLEQQSHLFAGAKVVTQLDRYEENLGIVNFDLAVDFGWFYFLTKPLFYALHWLHEVLGNFGLAILAVTVGIKLVFFPLANKSYMAMAKMRKLQPKMMELRERFGEDRQRLNQEMMALYKREGANPMAGCLPIIVQIPVFFALYKVMFVTIEMRHAPFFGWIRDLSAPDPTSILNGFGLLPWDVPELGVLGVINIGVWPLIMGLSMYLQQRLNPQPPDPMQAKIFMLMPIVFTFLLATFPAGLVIYWTWNNLLSILQQAVIMKRAGVPLGRGQKSST